MQPLLERLMTTFPDAVRGVEVDTARNEITARIAAARIVDVARWLHDTPEASFDHITDIGLRWSINSSRSRTADASD